MADIELRTKYSSVKLFQLKRNIKSWGWGYWILFYIVIPLILSFILFLPQTIKADYFILKTSHLFEIATFLHSYTHSSFPHFFWNVCFYFFYLTIIFVFESEKRIFKYSALCFFILVPIITALSNYVFFYYMGLNNQNQGFSAIVNAFYAYALLSVIRFGTMDIFHILPDWQEINNKQKFGYLIIFLIIGVLLLVLGITSIMIGRFLEGGDAISNGLSHYIGFTLGIIIPTALFRKFKEKDNTFDSMLIFMIFITSIFYYQYLHKIVQSFNGTG